MQAKRDLIDGKKSRDLLTWLSCESTQSSADCGKQSKYTGKQANTQTFKNINRHDHNSTTYLYLAQYLWLYVFGIFSLFVSILIHSPEKKKLR